MGTGGVGRVPGAGGLGGSTGAPLGMAATGAGGTGILWAAAEAAAEEAAAEPCARISRLQRQGIAQSFTGSAVEASASQ